MLGEITADQLETLSEQPQGPSSRGCCKVTTGNVCGSGSLVGVIERNGVKHSLVLTNAHVAGTRPGKTGIVCTFPFAGNKRVGARILMAGYSDRVMMDWCVLELDEYLTDLPHVKLKNEVPQGSHYTGGYPRCRGPYFSTLRTVGITHSGTVWRWQPNSIGGQSGSGVHSAQDNLQYGLLTWSWGGDGAGQTARSIWFQYVNRAAIGFPRPAGMIELGAEDGNRVDDLEEGFFAEANITTLPIWDHLDDGPDEPGPDDPEPPEGGCPELAAKIKEHAEALQKQAAQLAELARRYEGDGCNDDDDGDDGGNDTGPLFGLG